MLQIALIVVVALFSLIFFLRKRISVIFNTFGKLIFPLGIIFCLISILWSYPFELAADLTLKGAGTYSSLQTADNTINTFIPNNLFKEITDIFNGDEKVQDRPQDEQNGVLLKTIYPGLVSAIALIIRIFSFVVSAILMFVGTYASYTTDQVSDIEKLRKRVKELEERLKD